MLKILCIIILWIAIIAFVSVICNLILELYIGSLPSNEQDEVVNKINKTITEIKNKFINFWK